MITVTEADHIISQHSLTLESETVPLDKANGKILNEPIVADRDFPPFDRVTMDGVAISFEGWETGTREFSIAGVQAAGDPPLTIPGSNQAIEVMTGAVLPTGADTVIPYESIQINGESEKTAAFNDSPVKGKNIHRKGSDRKNGTVIIEAGSPIGPPEIGILATVGKTMVKVLKPPAVAIISTGDELVPVNQVPLPHQIRSSNAATLASALSQWNIKAELHHIIDDLNGTTEKLGQLLESHQILILSGGVSKGKFDYVPEALQKLGVQKHFHKIKQRPGKPFWFGSHKSGALVFAFPGNPVSSFMCFTRYFKPWLDGIYGIQSWSSMAQLGAEINFQPELTYFAQVRIKSDQQIITALPVEGHGSGDLANLVDADGFIELPSDKDRFLKGELYPLFPYRNLAGVT